MIFILIFLFGFWGTVEAATYQFRYEVNLEPSLEMFNKEISVWVPYPPEDLNQKVLQATITAPWPYRITREKKHGNKMIYLKGKLQGVSQKIVFEYYIERNLNSGTSGISPALYLGSDKRIPLYPLIQEIAQKESQGLSKSSQKIQAFYNYVVRTMKYDKSGKGWGEGDAVWACTHKRGNCTDFHSLFIGLNRSEKIPALFEIGFLIPDEKEEGEILGYHCWAEAYAQDLRKWIPVDTTQKYFGNLPDNRILFTRGRDILLNPPQKSEPLNYFIYPYAEVEGIPFLSFEKKFYFKKQASKI